MSSELGAECGERRPRRAGGGHADGRPPVLTDGGQRRDLVTRIEALHRAASETGNATTVSVGPLDDREGFYVADDGPGIDPERREEVFESGVTSERGGTGFGLRIVEELATANDWAVALTDSADGGARFEFEFETG